MKIKLTLKTFKALLEEERETFNKKERIKRSWNRNISSEEYEEVKKMEQRLEEIKSIIENNANIILAKYSIGHRTYYEKILKFSTKSFRTLNGIAIKHFTVTEITEITEEMKKRMKEDIHYY